MIVEAPPTIWRKPQFLTASQAARRLGVSVDTVRRWNDQGLIKSTRTPKNHRRFDVSEVERIIAGEPSAVA